MTENVSVQEDVVSDSENPNTDIVASLFNAWHDLRTAATEEIASFEVYKQELEIEFQTKADIITVRNARYNQLLFIVERIKLNLESQAAGKDTLFPDITDSPEDLLIQAFEWLESDSSYAPEDLLAKLNEARAAEVARVEAENNAVNGVASAATEALTNNTNT